MMNWRLMLYPSLPGFRQMAMDEALYLSAQRQGFPTLRLYTWQRPTLSLGYFQDYKRVVCEPFIGHNNIHVVRRLTGGRAVLHDLEMTYAVAAPLDKGIFKNCSLQETYQLIAKALNLALQNLGVERSSISMELDGGRAQSRKPQCFVSVSRFELAENRRKIIGSAQKRSRISFLQHGSILLDFNAELQMNCVHNPDPEITEKIAPLKWILGRTPGFDELRNQIVKGFEIVFGVKIEEAGFDTEEAKVVSELELKYKSEAWTYRACK